MNNQVLPKSVTEKINERASLMLKDKSFKEIYDSKESQEAATQWIIEQAIYTLYYSHDERMAHFENGEFKKFNPAF